MDNTKEGKASVSKFLKESQDRIFVNNRAWVEAKRGADGEFFNKLASGQQPDYLCVLPSFTSLVKGMRIWWGCD